MFTSKPAALDAPNLTVSSTIITVTDHVTLTCEPPYVSVDRCYFYIDETPAPFPDFSCYNNSAWSDKSSITVQGVPAPGLTVSPRVITESDSVTLSCQTPSSAPDVQCYFSTTGARYISSEASCQQSFTGTELLQKSQQSSPAEVAVMCHYAVHQGTLTSPQSNKSFITVQGVPAPGLTVSRTVITESDSVTLSCQTPSSAPDVQCYFSTTGARYISSEASCQQSFTGTELLQRSQQSSPAEVAVICHYAVHQGTLTSPQSNKSSITVQGVPAPGLTVSRTVITESDSVTLSCQTPSPARDIQCYFYTVRMRHIPSEASCQQSFTGTELLQRSQQSSPARVTVICQYAVQQGSVTSPWSDISSITVQASTQPAKPGHTHINEGSAEKGGKGEKPEMSCHHDAEHVVMTCSLPGSAKPHTVCNFYVGEARSPVGTQTIRDKVSASNKWFCQFYVQIADFLRDLRPVQPKVASCDSSLESEPNSVSARSDEYSLTGIWEKESSRLQTIQTPTMSTAVMTEISTYTTPAGGFGEAATSVPALEGSSDKKITENFETVMTEISTYTTPDVVIQTEISPSTTPGLPRHQPTTRSNSSAAAPGTPASKKETLKWVLVVAGCGVFAGIILLGSALMCIKRRRDDSMHTRALIHEGATSSAGNTELYSMISSVPGHVFPKGSVELKGHEAAYEDPDTYHMYCSITEEPAAAAQTHDVYSTVQLH
ncbi:uncharacterized protein LOC143005494 isoform X3 [Genypterus blacodes]|uniref:uncharacterized protein LOC143005494 isoform X3 n=1 Tax=Genypterus blacodes TaxID=154954 RepID=UPI003F76669F